MRCPLEAVVAASLLLALLGCSSLPKQPDQVNTVKNQAAQLAQSGNGYYAQGNYPEAQKLFALALDADLSIYYVPGIITSYNSLGKVYLAAGRDDQAEADFQSAYDLAQKAADQALLEETVCNLGELLLEEGKFNDAMNRFESALAKTQDAQSGLAGRLYHDLGAADRSVGDYPHALLNLGKAVAIHSGRNEYVERASDYYMIASVYSKEGSFSPADANARLALADDQRMENGPGIGSDYRALGLIAEKAGNPSDAYDDFLASYRVFRALDLVPEVESDLAHLASVATALGRTQDASAYAAALASLKGAP